jgi:hypothetical protein
MGGITRDTNARADAKNATKGGWGIDGDKDKDFTKANPEDMRRLFGRGGAWNKQISDSEHMPVDCDYDEDVTSGSDLLDNAREASPNTPLLYNDGTKGMSQTGMPKNRARRRLSGAF